MIANSTPLIYLAKLGKIGLLRSLFPRIYIPEAVKQEVIDQGKAQYEPDAFIVEQAIQEGWIIVRKTKPLAVLQEMGIDLGELEAISLAVEMKRKEILLDQTHARIAAELVGLTPRGTLYVLLRALKENKISLKEYRLLLESLLVVGFRMSEELYLNAIKIGEQIKK